MIGVIIAHTEKRLILLKETAFERADFTFQLLMFVNAEKEGQMFIIFILSIFCQLFPPVLSKDIQSSSRQWKLRPTGLEVTSFQFSLFNPPVKELFCIGILSSGLLVKKLSARNAFCNPKSNISRKRVQRRKVPALLSVLGFHVIFFLKNESCSNPTRFPGHVSNKSASKPGTTTEV